MGIHGPGGDVECGSNIAAFEAGSEHPRDGPFTWSETGKAIQFGSQGSRYVHRCRQDRLEAGDAAKKLREIAWLAGVEDDAHCPGSSEAGHVVRTCQSVHKGGKAQLRLRTGQDGDHPQEAVLGDLGTKDYDVHVPHGRWAGIHQHFGLLDNRCHPGLPSQPVPQDGAEQRRSHSEEQPYRSVKDGTGTSAASSDRGAGCWVLGARLRTFISAWWGASETGSVYVLETGDRSCSNRCAGQDRWKSCWGAVN